jgi:hypothetical protein
VAGARREISWLWLPNAHLSKTAKGAAASGVVVPTYEA